LTASEEFVEKVSNLLNYSIQREVRDKALALLKKRSNLSLAFKNAYEAAIAQIDCSPEGSKVFRDLYVL